MRKIDFEIDGKLFNVNSDFESVETFKIKSSPKPYQVSWAEDSEHQKIKKIMSKNPNNILFVDEKVYKLHLKDLGINENQIYKIKATEENKDIKSVLKFIEFLETKNFTKAETLVVVGGGIPQDIGAFVGAVYKRGINWVLFPTTLLSMSDSCIGGKTGINHSKSKNQLALFSAPKEVIINPAFIKTLEESEISSGLGEILKLLITGDMLGLYPEYVTAGKVNSFESYKPLILGSLNVKKEVIEEDEFEKLYRKSLNYGHTLGHAIEVLSNYKIPHGQAVVIGMLIVNEISRRRGMLTEDETSKIKQYAKDIVDLKLVSKIKTSGMADLLRKDKKTMGSQLTLVVMESVGNTEFLKMELGDKILTEIDDILKKGFAS